MHRVLVGLISHNRFSCTERVLPLIAAASYPHTLLIVDNGSSRDVKRKLSEVALDYGAHLLSIENRNCNGARGLIAHYGIQFDVVVFVDNDAELPDGWLASMIDTYEVTASSIVGVSQSSSVEVAPTFFGDFGVKNRFLKLRERSKAVTKGELVDWVTGHCMLLDGEFLREIWSRYKFWSRHLLFPIDYDDIDLMMMARDLGKSVAVAPVIASQMKVSKDDATEYHLERNDFQNYALSCVSFWREWGLNPLLNWNQYGSAINKSGIIFDAGIKIEFLELVEMLKKENSQIHDKFDSILSRI